MKKCSSNGFGTQYRECQRSVQKTSSQHQTEPSATTATPASDMQVSRSIESVDQAFEWPASEAPDPFNLTLASKMCVVLILGDPSIQPTVTYFTSGWSSNDVIAVTTLSFQFIVKLPRQPILPNAALTCKAEAMRTAWAAKHGLSPKVLRIDPESGGFAMERLRGHTLTMDMIKSRLPAVIRLLRRIHTTAPAKWMWRYDPVGVVKNQLESVKSSKAMESNDVILIEKIISNTANMVKGHSWVLCHNDFHSHNIFLQPAETRFRADKLMAIDFEESDLGDPMWDLAYLIVNLELEQAPHPMETLYGVTSDEQLRVRAYVPLALAHCAIWAAERGGAWVQHFRELMERLKGVVDGSNRA
ncbi:MAG: hypothetical protein Q9215_003377 [Flavoplaca cf. flavocitrina]